jgi:hypothetical protein
MRSFLRCVCFVALAFAPFVSEPAGATHARDCRKSAVENLHASADGYAVYQQITDKKFFLNWITCDDGQFSLPTAVHESVHYVTAEEDAFPLVEGGEIKRPHEVSKFFAPSAILRKFKANNDFVATYLRPGRATSSSDFLYLLDELNAYTHDLNAAIDLIKLRRKDEYIDNRDGLAALMAFVALYIEKAEASEPATWSGLQKPEVAKTLTELWGHAEKVMSASCGIPHFGSYDKTFIRQFCEPAAQSSLQTIIGRAPVCPTECLKATEDDEATAADEEQTDAAPPEPSTRTIWSRRNSHRVTSAGDPQSDEKSTSE